MDVMRRKRIAAAASAAATVGRIMGGIVARVDKPRSARGSRRRIEYQTVSLRGLRGSRPVNAAPYEEAFTFCHPAPISTSVASLIDRLRAVKARSTASKRVVN